MLSEIIKEIKHYEGILRKGPIVDVVRLLGATMKSEDVVTTYPEDATAIRDKDGYLLLAADGIISRLVEQEPYAAGKSAVMVCVNDIYAMGGRPIAMVNVISSNGSSELKSILKGIKRGCEKFAIPMVGGHLHPDSSFPSISVAILGRAKRLLLSNNARQGQDIILAVDLDGDAGCKSVRSWDSNSGKTTEQVLERLEVLVRIAERGYCRTAKDVSNGGILGTLGILLESSHRGAVVDLKSIPKPQGIELVDWMRAFLSYGFIITCEPCNTARCIDEFLSVGVEARCIGRVTAENKLVLKVDGEEGVLWDFNRERILTYANAKSSN